MIIFGITGPIGHGKTTLATMLVGQSEHAVSLETGLLVAEVADKLNGALGKKIPTRHQLAAINTWLQALPEIVKEVTQRPCSFEDIKLTSSDVKRDAVSYEKLFAYLEQLAKQPSMAAQRITIENKQFYRPLLQWLGGYLIKKVHERIWYDELLRRLQQNQNTELGIIGGLRYPSDATAIKAAGGLIIEIDRPNQPRVDLKDPTERTRQQIKADIHVVNDGTLDQLQTLATQLLTDARYKDVQRQYIASTY